MPGPSRRHAALAAGFAALTPGTALAHTAFQSLGSFWSGVAHVLASPDQIALFLALAIWVSLHNRRSDACVVGAAFSGFCVGVVLGATFGSQFAAVPSLAALMVLVGLAGAVQFQTGPGPLIAIASAGGLLGGAASSEGVAGVALALFSLGGSVAAASVISWGLIAARRVNFAWGRIALRTGASWIATIGLMTLALAGSRYFGHR
jgi:urease accessory protein